MPVKQHYFVVGLISLCILYLGFELFFNHYAMISVDEFWFAHRIYEYKSGLPYHDFAPYKTVFGYYLLLIPMLLSQGILSTLIFTKNAIAVLNTCILLGSAWWLRRFFSSWAILTSLALLISAEIVLAYSTNIRVDLLAYWFCFFSLLFLLENRFLLAGLLIGLGFITSQKAIWYIFASNFALVIQWLVMQRNIKMLWNILRFNLVTLGVIAVYILLWSQVADLHTVLNSVFFEASAMYQLDWYDSSRKLFWTIIIHYNPLLFLLWPLTLISIFVSYDNDHSYPYRLFISCYTSVILLCLIFYRQVFPYYMQATIPVFFVLYTAFFTWLFVLFQPERRFNILLLGKTGVWLFLLTYIIAIIYLKSLLQLPAAYLLICVIPLLLGLYITHRVLISTQLIYITILFMGSIYPLSLFAAKLLNINGAYQKANIEAVNTLLQDNSDYIAGIELIYNKTQPIAGLRHLMGPAIDYLYVPDNRLRPIMTASLGEDPEVSPRSIITALENSNVKFFVNNYRMHALPPSIKNYLSSQYEHLWGSIYYYAPQFPSGLTAITVKFSGNYRIEAIPSTEVFLNGKAYSSGTILHLEKGHYASHAPIRYRLKLLPQQSKLYLDPQFAKDEFQKIIF